MSNCSFKETKYSWLIVAISFYAQIFSGGILFSFGALYVQILKEYDVAKAEAAWIGSLAFSVCFFFGFLSSNLCARFGCNICMSLGGLLTGMGLLLSSYSPTIEMLYITYGLIVGFGMSLLFFSSSLAVPLYFNKRLTVANGIVSAGTCISGLGLSPFLGFMNKNYGLKTTFQLLSTFLIVPCLTGFLIRRKMENKELVRLNNFFDRRLLRNRSFIVFLIAMCIMMSFYYTPFVHLINYAELKGVPLMDATLLSTILGACSFLGKLLSGMIGQLKAINRMYLFQFAMMAMSVLLTLLPLATKYYCLAIIAALFGFADGTFSSYVFVITNEVVHPGQIYFAFGLLHTVTSCFSMIGPPVAGAVFSATSSYEISFMLCGSGFVTAAVLLFLIPCLKKKIEKYDSNVSITSANSETCDEKAEICSLSNNDSGVSCDSIERLDDMEYLYEDKLWLDKPYTKSQTHLNVETIRPSMLASNLSIASSMWSIAPHCFASNQSNQNKNRITDV